MIVMYSADCKLAALTKTHNSFNIVSCPLNHGLFNWDSPRRPEKKRVFEMFTCLKISQDHIILHHHPFKKKQPDFEDSSHQSSLSQQILGVKQSGSRHWQRDVRSISHPLSKHCGKSAQFRSFLGLGLHRSPIFQCCSSPADVPHLFLHSSAASYVKWLVSATSKKNSKFNHLDFCASLLRVFPCDSAMYP